MMKYGSDFTNLYDIDCRVTHGNDKCQLIFKKVKFRFRKCRFRVTRPLILPVERGSLPQSANTIQLMSANKLAEDSVENKKKTTSIEIIDVFTKNIRANNTFSTTLSQAKTLHSNAARWNEALTPKTFLMKKKKAKGLSIFKKKILMVH